MGAGLGQRTLKEICEAEGIALERAPDELNRSNIESLIPRLEAGEDIN